MTVAVVNRQRVVQVDVRLLKSLATRALTLVGSPNDSLNIVLVDDAEIAGLNARFHHVEGPTDILSFEYGKRQGELTISVERAVAHARRYHTTPGRELALYVVHGILHLHGYNDLKPRQRRRMRAAERRLLSRLATHFDVRHLVRAGRQGKA